MIAAQLYARSFRAASRNAARQGAPTAGRSRTTSRHFESRSRWARQACPTCCAVLDHGSFLNVAERCIPFSSLEFQDDDDDGT